MSEYLKTVHNQDDLSPHWHHMLKGTFSLGTEYEIKYFIMKTGLFKYIENFTTKNWKFSDKKFW